MNTCDTESIVGVVVPYYGILVPYYGIIVPNYEIIVPLTHAALEVVREITKIINRSLIEHAVL